MASQGAQDGTYLAIDGVPWGFMHASGRIAMAVAPLQSSSFFDAQPLHVLQCNGVHRIRQFERTNWLPNCLIASDCAAENSSHNWNLETLSTKLNGVILKHLEVWASAKVRSMSSDGVWSNVY